MHISLVRGRHPLSIHVVWLIILPAVLVLSRLFRPPACAFHSITGLPCLSCGLTRAADAFLRGDFASMVYMNPLAVIFCAALAFYSFSKLVEYLFNFRIMAGSSPGVARLVRLTVLFSVAANWFYLIAMGR